MAISAAPAKPLHALLPDARPSPFPGLWGAGTSFEVENEPSSTAPTLSLPNCDKPLHLRYQEDGESAVGF